MTGLRVLHLFANYKWTGPADPAVRAVAALRRLGADVRFAQAGWQHPGTPHWLAGALWDQRVPVVGGLELRKHFHLGALRRDVRALRRLVARDRYDVVHCHLLGDHLTAALALPALQPRPLLVRTLYDPEPPRRGWRNRLCFARTDAVLAPTLLAAEGMRQGYRLAADRVVLQEPVTEAKRPGGDLRARWGIAADAFVVGITARIQPHRRFELLWQVAQRVAAQAAGRPVHFVLLGRGNERDTRRLVTEPVAQLGLGAVAVLPGYLAEPDYSAALRSLDAFLFLVPGSDGTCRAVREAMGHGLPVVATRRGILPELLRERGGLVPGAAVGESVDELSAALLALLHDPERRRRQGEAARTIAAGDMDPDRAARQTLALYERLRGAQ